MKKRSKKLKHKLLSLQYVNTNCPIPTDVDDFITAIKRFRNKNGARPYQKNRVRTDKLVRRLLTKHHIIGTVSSYFWYLEGVCILIQKNAEQLAREFKLARNIARRAEKKTYGKRK